jgi:hypothetical protein
MKVILNNLDFYIHHFCDLDDLISRCSSNSKDTMNIKQSNGEKKSIFCRFMLMSLTEAFELFKVSYRFKV